MTYPITESPQTIPETLKGHRLFIPGESVLLVTLKEIFKFHGAEVLEADAVGAVAWEVLVVLPDFVERSVEARARLFREQKLEFTRLIFPSKDLIVDQEIPDLLSAIREAKPVPAETVFRRLHWPDYEKLCHELKYLFLPPGQASSWFYYCSVDSLEQWRGFFQDRLNKCACLAERMEQRAGSNLEATAASRVGSFVRGLDRWFRETADDALEPQVLYGELTGRLTERSGTRFEILKQHWRKPEASHEVFLREAAETYAALALPSPEESP